MPLNTHLLVTLRLAEAAVGTRVGRVHSLTVKPLWTSLGWARTVKSVLMALRLSSVGSGLDESWLQRPKAGGIQASNWPGERGCQSEREEGLKLFKQLPQDQEDHSPRLRERLLETQIWAEEEKDVMQDRLKSTIRPLRLQLWAFDCG